MDKPINSMNLSELLEYCVKHKLNPQPTGRNGKITKRDYIEVIKHHQEELRVAKLKQNEEQSKYIANYFNSLQGLIEMYDLELNGVCKRMNSIVCKYVEEKKRGIQISPEHTKYILQECKTLQERGYRDFDHIIPALTDSLNEDNIL